MAPPKKQIPHFEVDDPAEAMRKAQDFTRRILAVPKSEIDAKLAKEAKHKSRKR
jgi:hypothetical protein